MTKLLSKRHALSQNILILKNRRLCELSLCHSSYYIFMRERGFKLFLMKLQLANKIPLLHWWVIFFVQTTRSAPVSDLTWWELDMFLTSSGGRFVHA